MAFPTVSVNTTNLDSSTDDPSLARADLLDAVQKLNTIIDEANDPGGVSVLDNSGYIPTTQIPSSINVGGTMTLSSDTNIVNIQNILRLTPQTQAQIVAISSPVQGDIVICSNITTANVFSSGMAIYSGTNWQAIPFNANVFVTLS